MKNVQAGQTSMKRKPRANSIAGIYQDASCRMKAALGSKKRQYGPISESDRLLLRAEKAIRHKIWLRKTLPLNVLMFLPGLLFIGTRSRLVLAVFVATYPLVFVIRAVLAQALSSCIGSEEIMLRMEYEKISSKQNTTKS